MLFIAYLQHFAESESGLEQELLAPVTAWTAAVMFAAGNSEELPPGAVL